MFKFRTKRSLPSPRYIFFGSRSATIRLHIVLHQFLLQFLYNKLFFVLLSCRILCNTSCRDMSVVQITSMFLSSTVCFNNSAASLAALFVHLHHFHDPCCIFFLLYYHFMQCFWRHFSIPFFYRKNSSVRHCTYHGLSGVAIFTQNIMPTGR